MIFEITDPGFSPDYRHGGIQFHGGRYEAKTKADIEALRGCRWCSEIKDEEKTNDGDD